MSQTVQEQTGQELLSVRGITKRFGLNVVLKGIDLSVGRGEVLTLIGGNGAGKSTLMKIIMGIYQPDQGELYIDGERISSFKPVVSLQKGIYMVPQEPMLFPNMTVEENILIGFTGVKSELHSRLVKIVKDIGWNLDLSRKALSLSIAEQQIVELLRGMMRNAKVLILDEPTSALTFDEVEALFKVVTDLKSRGIGIIYITHRMAEVFTIGTHVAIMRDGVITLKGPIGDFTREMLVKGLLPKSLRWSGRQGRSRRSLHGCRLMEPAPLSFCWHRWWKYSFQWLKNGPERPCVPKHSGPRTDFHGCRPDCTQWSADYFQRASARPHLISLPLRGGSPGESEC